MVLFLTDVIMDFATLFLVIALFITMLGMGLSLTIDDFKRVALYPKAVIIGLINQIIFLPAIGFVLANAFNLSTEITVGLMILAACPGGPTSNLISHLAKGDTALSVTLTAISSLVTFITIPLIISFSLSYFQGEGVHIQLDILQVIGQILIVTVIPISIGMIIRNKQKDFALRMDRPVRIVSVIVLAVVIFGLVLKEKANVVNYFVQAGSVALVLNVLSMVVGYYSAKIIKLNTAQSITISIESGIQNGTLAIAIATGILANTGFAITPAVYSLIMFITGFVVIMIGNKFSTKQK